MTHNTLAPIADKVLAERLAELPYGEWEVWTSCSFRRISRVGGGDGDVLCGVIQRSDGHPDLSMTEKQLEAICWLVNSARSGQLVTLAEAQAMVAAERERCAALIDEWWRGGVDTGVPADMIRALSPTNAKPQTDYERKVAQMKEDFPNGI